MTHLDSGAIVLLTAALKNQRPIYLSPEFTIKTTRRESVQPNVSVPQ